MNKSWYGSMLYSGSYIWQCCSYCLTFRNHFRSRFHRKKKSSTSYAQFAHPHWITRTAEVEATLKQQFVHCRWYPSCLLIMMLKYWKMTNKRCVSLYFLVFFIKVKHTWRWDCDINVLLTHCSQRYNWFFRLDFLLGRNRSSFKS